MLSDLFWPMIQNDLFHNLWSHVYSSLTAMFTMTIIQLIRTPCSQPAAWRASEITAASVTCLSCCDLSNLSSRLLWQVAWLVVWQTGPTYLEQGIFPAFHELMTLGVPHQSAHVVWVWSYGYCCYSDDISMKLFAIGVKDNCTLPFCIIFCGCKRW